MYLLLPIVLSLVPLAFTQNFPYESILLIQEDTTSFPSIAFASTSAPSSTPPCKSFPSSASWPLPSTWTALNTSLSGALLASSPPASVCYNNNNTAACTFLLFNASTSRVYLDDPLTVLTSWPQGDTCYAIANPPAGVTCTQGGFPSFVVNVTTVKQIQMAVNFARNRNIRLVIKNTGHDFLGRSVGAGSLSVWTHNLKSFSYFPSFTHSTYTGRAARLGAGLEAWELYPYMEEHDMAVVVPAGSTTVGVVGGWLAGGGHSVLSSYWGMGADQVLELNIVTADGRFVVANSEENTDLFYALRGGGGSTYGIVTSALVKAYPRLTVTMAPLNFAIRAPNNTAADLSAFWTGVSKFFYYGKYITSLGGTAFSNVIQTSNTSYSFTNTFEMPGMSNQQVISATQPLFDSLTSIGLSVGTVSPAPSLLWAPSTRQGKGDQPGNIRFASRIFPKQNWDNETIFDRTMAAVRESVEAGYTFHGIHMAPTEEVGGYPDNAVNIAFRNTFMHADSFDFAQLRGKTVEENRISHERHALYMDKIRALTPGGGAYVNEADLLEPSWQESFFGRDNYAKLVEIKRKVDPWGVFYAPKTPGSEGWSVESVDGGPNQNGRLCRVEK